MKKLYSLVTTNDETKSALYIRNNILNYSSDKLLDKDTVLDFSTYFNSFSIKKWKKYTTIQSLTLELEVEGDFEITVFTYSHFGSKVILQEKTDSRVYRHTWNLQELQGDILGFSLRVVKNGAIYRGGAYYGEFTQWQNIKIGIGICTFKREEYVGRTLDVLKCFERDHKWLQVLVVDNGSTLQEQDKDGIRIIHNRNFGGSGGFTRAMIEYVDEDQVDYILLMDDDIILEPSALERSHSLLCGLREEYKDSFLSGAMLTMENPVIQHENTAYWNRIISKVIHKGLNLSEIRNLICNENEKKHKNQYAGWWYCCIPIKRIREIGYPLPVFIKGDDMEYSIRNGKELLTLNGIGVWHEIFSKKMSSTILFFSDRNSFILNHYAHGCNLGTLLLAIAGRLYKRILKGDIKSIQILLFALQDYFTGFQQITNKRADIKFSEVSETTKIPLQNKNFIELFRCIVKICENYKKIDADYQKFFCKNLKTNIFWKKYLDIK